MKIKYKEYTLEPEDTHYNLYKDVEKEIMEKVIETNLSVKEVRNKIKKRKFKEDIQQQKEDIEQGKTILPEGVFEIINIDPPWNYGTSFDGKGRRVANPYPEMSQEELKQLEIPSADNSVLFLWTTHKFIWDAKDL